jgi:hypothetical protein
MPAAARLLGGLGLMPGFFLSYSRGAWCMIQLSFVSLVLAAAMATHATTDTVSAVRLKNRMLVVVAPTPTNENFATQRRIFDETSSGMLERDVILVEMIGEDASARTLRQRLGLVGNDFRALLVGKDGHIAMRSEEPLTADTLFRTIDAMPMRQTEMRQRL